MFSGRDYIWLQFAQSASESVDHKHCVVTVVCGWKLGLQLDHLRY